MNYSFTTSLSKLLKRQRSLAMLLATLFTLGAFLANAQSSNAPANTFSPLITDTYASLTVTSSQNIFANDEFDNKNRLIDLSLTNTSEWEYLATGSAWIQVKDNNATGANVYPAGSYAGFVISDADLAVLGETRIKTYLGGVLQENKSASSLLSLGIVFSGAAKIGFIATKDFDAIRYEASAIGIGSKSVYYAEVKRFAPGPALPCNTPTALTSPAYPVSVDAAFSGVCAGCTIGNTNNMIDTDPANHTDINMAVGLLATAVVSTKSNGQTYPIGTYAGFDIATTGLLGLDVSSGLKVETFLNGVSTGQSVGTGSLVGAGSSLLSQSGRQTIGFVSTAEFDEVRFSVNKLAGVNLGVIEIYGTVLTRFCLPTNPLECNTLTSLSNPDFPVYISGANTGISSTACVGCAVSNTANVLDGLTTNFATVNLSVGIAATGSFAVANPLETYPANTYAAFEIESDALLAVDVTSNVTLTLWNNGSQVQTLSGADLLAGVSSGLLTDPSRQIVGLVSNVPFDEVKISFDQVVGANLGSIKIYRAIIDKLCAPTLLCNTTAQLIQPAFPVVINSEATGVSGTACVGCNVANPWNVLSTVDGDFATLSATAGVGSTSTLAVVDPLTTYPIGTAVGFAITNPTVLAKLNLFNNITISTYNNGAFQESKSGTQLLELNLDLNLFGGTPAERYNIALTATEPFDEVRISLTNVVGVLNTINVYSAFVDTRAVSDAAGLTCLKTAPDFNVTNPDVLTAGNVSTNDFVTGTVTYGTPVPNASNPAVATLTMNPDGSYTFSSATPGVYLYDVPVCLAGQTTGCATESLRITVLDPNSNTNPPAANPDFASITGNDTTPTAVTVNVKANDGPGNVGGTLGTPTIPAQPANGTASIDGSGNVVFTPNAGFYGKEIITYEICESPSGLCTTTDLHVNVLVPAAPATVSAADDYITVPKNIAVTTTAATGVITNDYDSGGNALTVTPQNSSIAGVGTLNLLADGSYTFTPETGYTGPASFPYTVCNSESKCATATLYVLVKAMPDLTPAQLFSALQLKADNSNTIQYIVAISNVGTAATGSAITFTVSKFPAGSGIALATNPSGSVTIFGKNFTLSNSEFVVTETPTAFEFTSIVPATVINIAGVKYIGFTITRTGGTPETLMNTVTITEGTGGGETPTINNVIVNPVTKL